MLSSKSTHHPHCTAREFGIGIFGYLSGIGWAHELALYLVNRHDLHCTENSGSRWAQIFLQSVHLYCTKNTIYTIYNAWHK